jgi:hypothetical protein
VQIRQIGVVPVASLAFGLIYKTDVAGRRVAEIVTLFGKQDEVGCVGIGMTVGQAEGFEICRVDNSLDAVLMYECLLYLVDHGRMIKHIVVNIDKGRSSLSHDMDRPAGDLVTSRFD